MFCVGKCNFEEKNFLDKWCWEKYLFEYEKIVENRLGKVSPYPIKCWCVIEDENNNIVCNERYKS